MNSASQNYLKELHINHLNVRSLKRLGEAWGDIQWGLDIADSETFRQIIKHSHLGRDHLDIMARRLVATYARLEYGFRYRLVAIEYLRMDDNDALHTIRFIARLDGNVRWVQHVLPLRFKMLRAAAYSDIGAGNVGLGLDGAPHNAIETVCGETPAEEGIGLVDMAVGCANGCGLHADLIEILGSMSDTAWRRFERDMRRRGSFIK